MIPRKTSGQLPRRDLAEATEEGRGARDDLGARPRVDSGVDLHDARSGLGLHGDEQPSAADVERQRAYSDWLARFEPREDRRGEVERRRGLVADEVDPGPDERAA